MCRSRYCPAISAKVGSVETTARARDGTGRRVRGTRDWDRRDERRTRETTVDITPPGNAASCRVHMDALIAAEVQSNVSGVKLRGRACNIAENGPNFRAMRCDRLSAYASMDPRIRGIRPELAP